MCCWFEGYQGSCDPGPDKTHQTGFNVLRMLYDLNTKKRFYVAITGKLSH